MGERLIEELDPEGMWWHKAQRSRAALQWAAAAVQSRAHASRNGTALVPLADAFNHSCSPNAEVFEGTTTFQVRALRIIDPGEELTISYGHFSNSELLFNAGFVLDVNPDDYILVSRRELLEAAHRRWIDKGEEPPADLSERCEALGAGMPPPRLRAVLPLLGGAVPPKAVTMLAGLLVSRDTWAQFEEGGLGNLHDGWALEQSSTAEALRSDVTHAVYDLIEEIFVVSQYRLRSEVVGGNGGSVDDGNVEVIHETAIRQQDILLQPHLTVEPKPRRGGRRRRR